MPIEVRVSGENATELLTQLGHVTNLLLAGVKAPAPREVTATPVADKPVDEPKAAPAKRGRPKKAAEPEGEVTVEEVKNDVGFPESDKVGAKDEPSEAEAEPVPTVEEVRFALTAYMKEHGDEATLKLLKATAGVERLSQIKIADYRKVVDACKAAASDGEAE